MNKKTLSLLVLFVVAIGSVYILFFSDLPLERRLIANEWRSDATIHISKEKAEELEHIIGFVSKVNISSNTRFLSDGTYIRESNVGLYQLDNKLTASITISETGEWSCSDSVLLLSTVDTQGYSLPRNNKLTKEQIDVGKQWVILNDQQSKKLDVIDDSTILMSSLDNNTRLMVAED